MRSRSLAGANVAFLAGLAVVACNADDAVLTSSHTAGAGGAPSVGGSGNANVGGSASANGGASAGGGTGGAGVAGSAAAGASGAGAGCPGAPPSGFTATCTPEDRKARVTAAMDEPTILPRFLGGLDLGGPNGRGLSINDAEHGFVRQPFDRGAIHYPGGNVALCAPDGPDQIVWTDATKGSVGLDPGRDGFAVAFSRNEAFSQVAPDGSVSGYRGPVLLSSRPGSIYSKDNLHVYRIAPGVPVTRDGAEMALTWSSNSITDPSVFDELYDAAIFTSAPWVTPQPGVVDGGKQLPCAANGHCALGQYSDGTHVFYVASVGLGFIVQSADAPDVPINIQHFSAPRFPYSGGRASLALDGVDAHVVQARAGIAGNPCDVTIGTTVGDLTTSCLAITGDAPTDAQQSQSLLWGMVHDLDGFTLVDDRFKLRVDRASLADFDYLADGATPASDDVVMGFVTGSGNALVDDFAPPNSQDPGSPGNHAGSLIRLEMVRSIEARFQALRTDICTKTPCAAGMAPVRTIGDPACLGANVKTVGGVDTYPLGCTGLEGLITSAPLVSTPPPGEPYLAAATGSLVGASWGALYGNPAITVCKKKDDCVSLDHLYDLRARVTGSWSATTPVPAELSDDGYYFREWALATIRYVRAAVGATATVDQVHTATVDPDWISYSSEPDFTIARYVARDSATDASPPPTLVVTMQLSDTTGPSWTSPSAHASLGAARRLSRAERLIYRALREPTPSVPLAGPDADEALLTNLFGSPVLNAAWGAQPASCATAMTGCAVSAPRAADGTMAVDELGRPLLARYRGGILASSAFARGATDITVLGRDACAGVAKISFPQRTDPFAPVTATAAVWQGVAGSELGHVLGVPGAPVVDVLRFAGETATFDVGLTSTPAGSRVRSIEARGFLGRVFLCRDPATNELLSARTYTTLAEVQTWMGAYPAASTLCGLALRPQSNGAKVGFVDATTAGVTLELDPSGLRVVGATLWDATTQ